MNAACDTSLIHLAMVAPGETVRVIAVQGGQGLRRRLADLGMNEGEVLSVVQTDSGGPMILAVRDSRLAIGRGVAHKILVEVVGAQEG